MDVLGRRPFLISLTAGTALLAAPALALRSGVHLPPWRVAPRVPFAQCVFCGIGTNEQPLLMSGSLGATDCCLALAEDLFEELEMIRSGRLAPHATAVPSYDDVPQQPCMRCGDDRGPRIEGPTDALCRECVADSLPARRRLWPDRYHGRAG